MCNVVILYYIITVCEAWQNNLCLSGTLLTGCTTLVQVSTVAFIQQRWKKLQIWLNVSHEKYWFHCRDFHETLNLSINYYQTDLHPTSAKLGRGWGLQKIGENSFMLLCTVLLPLRRYSRNRNFHAYCWVRIPHWIVGKSIKNIRPGGKKSIHALTWSTASTLPKFTEFIVIQ